MAMSACKRGHTSGRDTDGHCSECRRQRARKSYARNIANERKRSKKYRKPNAARSRVGRLKDPERFRGYGRKYRNGNPEKTLLRAARLRARERGILCTITAAEIVIPKFCPLLGIRLRKGSGVGGAVGSSPSLDRKNPKRGYVPGNVWVISHRANSIKRDATLQELKLLVPNWTASCV